MLGAFKPAVAPPKPATKDRRALRDGKRAQAVAEGILGENTGEEAKASLNFLSALRRAKLR